MFCSEPVIAVYNGVSDHKANWLLDCFHGLAFHVTQGCRLVLETEHFFISLEAAGPGLDSREGPVNTYERPGELLDPYKPYDYESTLFVGERLIRVETEADHYLLEFDHFCLRLIPHDIEIDDIRAFKNQYIGSYNHICGCERFITEPCTCGGQGELLLDQVSDYVVRCRICGRSTRASYTVTDAIADWNEGKRDYKLPEIVIE